MDRLVRVLGCRNPPVAASQTVHAGNLVVMDVDHSFVVPLASDFGWNLKEAAQNLTWQFGTGDLTTLYERNGIYCFDAWAQPGPQRKGAKERSGANAVTQEQVSGRSLAASGVRISTEVEEKCVEIAEHESKWKTVPKNQTATKKLMASYGQGRSCKDGCINHDDGIW